MALNDTFTFRVARSAHGPVQGDKCILVLGLTGSGKSMFISRCTDQLVFAGHDLAPSTLGVNAFPLRSVASSGSDTSKTFLIDTPGFDNPSKPDTEILKDIADWLKDAADVGLRMCGVIFIQPITDRRAAGATVRALQVVRSLCGEDALTILTLATSMWDRIDQSEGSRKEAYLQQTPHLWGTLVAKGARVARCPLEAGGALHLIDGILAGQPKILLIQKELTLGFKFAETAAAMAASSTARIDVKNLEDRVKQAPVAKKKLLFDPLARHKFPIPPATRDAAPNGAETIYIPHTSRVAEIMSLTIHGKYFYYSGAEHDYWKLPGDMKLTEPRFSRYVNYGEDNGWYRHWHDAGKCLSACDLEMGYPVLSAILADGVLHQCPRHMSLGEGGYFFTIIATKRYFLLPDYILRQFDDMEDIEALWLGKDDAFVAQMKNGERKWDLCGNYPGLEWVLSGEDGERPRLKALTMDLENGTYYAAVWNNSGVDYRLSVPDSDSDDRVTYFELWSKKNLGLDFISRVPGTT